MGRENWATETSTQEFSSECNDKESGRNDFLLSEILAAFTALHYIKTCGTKFSALKICKVLTKLHNRVRICPLFDKYQFQFRVIICYVVWNGHSEILVIKKDVRTSTKNLLFYQSVFNTFQNEKKMHNNHVHSYVDYVLAKV